MNILKKNTIVFIMSFVFLINICFAANTIPLSQRFSKQNNVLGSFFGKKTGNAFTNTLLWNKSFLGDSGSTAQNVKTSYIPVKYRYYQGEARWNTEEYAKYNIRSSGCGPTAIAVVFASLTNQPITPIDIAKLDGYSDCTYTETLMNSAIKWVQNTYPSQAKNIKEWKTIKVGNINKLREVLKNKNEPIVGHITNHFFTIDCASYNEEKDTVYVTGYREQEGYTERALAEIFYGKNYSSHWSSRPMDEVYIFSGGLDNCVCSDGRIFTAIGKNVIDYKPVKYLNDFMILEDESAKLCEICGGKLNALSSKKSIEGKNYGMNIDRANMPISAEEFFVLLSKVVANNETYTNNNSYLADEMESSINNIFYLKLTQALGKRTGEKENLGEEEIKLILGNTDKEVLSNYKKSISKEKAANIMGAFINVDDTAISSANEFGFKDWSNVNSVYKKRINKLAKKGVFDTSEELHPQNQLTRADAVILVNRLYNVLY